MVLIFLVLVATAFLITAATFRPLPKNRRAFLAQQYLKRLDKDR